jgi:hypothetical protein
VWGGEAAVGCCGYGNLRDSTQAFDFTGHVRESVLDCLERTERSAELFTFAGIGD